MVSLIPLNVFISICLVIAILIAVIWYISSKNKKLYEKLISENARFRKYRQNVEMLKDNGKTPETDFKNLNSYVREFFKEYLNLDYSLTYLELSKIFVEQNKNDYSEFCKLMSEVNYSGKKSKPTEIKDLIEKFYKILREYK